MKQIDNNSETVLNRRRMQAGQSAVIAVIVLFLLMFIALIFISIVAGNLKNTQSAANLSAAGRYAEAGINYLDKQLTDSPEGADWRPVPDCQYGVACNNVPDSDPDYKWLRPCGTADNFEPCGYTRVPLGSDIAGTTGTAAQGGGRALVRVTYQPFNPNGQTNPLDRYIKLEVVGRVGQVLNNDPTTFGNTEPLNRRVELVAYKDIGLNSFVRNVTNKDNKPVTVELGDPFPVHDRNIEVKLESIYEGAVRVNAPLKFYGVNKFFFNPYRGDSLQVAGPITLNGMADTTTATATTDPTQVFITVTNAGTLTGVLAGTTPAVLPSYSPAFTTLGPELSLRTSGQIAGYALVRDYPRSGENVNLLPEKDAFGNSYQNLRSITAQAPPTIDKIIGQNGLTRYRALTRDSEALAPDQVTGNAINNAIITSNRAGLYGWGQGLYIPNSSDTQPASPTLSSSYSLRADWINPAAFRDKGYWNGDSLYTPPAVTITLHPGYFTLERPGQDGQKIFRRPDGTRIDVNKILRYTTAKPSALVSNVDNGLMFRGYPATQQSGGYYQGDYVIYAEGNIRIKGVVGGVDPESGNAFLRHLTVVSNGTIYIDGNLLRDNIPAESDPLFSTLKGQAAARMVRGQSTLALLAKDYICVNTTQFFRKDVNKAYTSESLQPNVPPYAADVNPGETLSFYSAFGPLLTADGFITPGYLNSTNPPKFYVRHAPGNDEGTSIVAQINPLPGAANYFNPATGALTGNTTTAPYALDAKGNEFLNTTLFLPAVARTNTDTLFPYYGNLGWGFENKVNITVDTPQSTYRISRAAVVPTDIRIEALMYAQEGSFFVIPGPWFNPDPNDSYSLFFGRGGYRVNDEPGRQRTDPFFPFYGEPLDVRMTFCGAINENLPAEVGDQGAWMEKWGWVPANYGSTGLTYKTGYVGAGNAVATAHAPNGILYQYDDRVIAPYAPSFSGMKGAPLRPNPYNPTQPLPFAPRLPVAPGLLYYGQSTVR